MSEAQRIATIRSVAEQAGVSVATVSRVINNPTIVAEDTRERVLKAIQDQKFRISREAQLTRRRHRALRTGRVGFLVPDVPNPATETITEEMGKGIQRALMPRAMELVMYYYPLLSDSPHAVPKMLIEDSVDGVLLRPPHAKERLLEFCRQGKVMLLANGFPDLDLPSVLTDDWAGLRLLMDYLTSLGHRRVAFVACTTHSILNLRRLQAYRAYYEEKGWIVDEQLVKIYDNWFVPADQVEPWSRRVLEELFALQPRVTAIVTSMDGLAAGLLQAAKHMKVRVPEDLSVTGYGDQYYTPFTDPPLTTLHVDYQAMGEIGTTQLLNMIEGANYSTQTLIRPTFVERRSCAEKPAGS